MEQAHQCINYCGKSNSCHDRIINILVFNILTLFLLMSCGDKKNSNHNSDSDTITGILIGDQVWAKTNLDVSTFRNGDSIPEVRSKEEWERAGKEGRPAWCYYENDPEKGKTYGRMYNWYALNDPTKFERTVFGITLDNNRHYF